MPNGRSGHFVISKAELLAILAEATDARPQGSVLPLPSDREVDVTRLKPTPLNAREISTLVHSHSDDTIFVEEQYQDSYCIHLDPGPSNWVSIHETSPLFPIFQKLLREYYSKRALPHGNEGEKK